MPTAGIVGSAEGKGFTQVHVDPNGSNRYATFMIYPAECLRVHISLEIKSVAHLVQFTTEAFQSLQWSGSEMSRSEGSRQFSRVLL